MVTNEPSEVGGRKRTLAVVGIMLAIIIALGVLFTLMVYALRADKPSAGGGTQEASQYAYAVADAANGMKLHYLATKPSNVRPEMIHNNVTLTEYTGINGGFFYGEQMLNIAVVDSLPVGRSQGKYGDGSENVRYARGTLVWDGALDKLNVQIVSKASELKVKDNTRFWAQGGISMSIGDDAGWEQRAIAENVPFPDEDRLRSAVVYDAQGMLYLIVSETKGTLAAFREAIIEKVGGGKLAGGIFLDGDGSSQLRSSEAKLAGDNRPVVQMLRVLK
ncbi:hypothetical protein [Paenibacillus harenae]|uniref:Phosphodiester glycosidase domain-containing protein n=1 Tax=Paenibacillus harenae TaxID=306543 RepID=A0ABT9UAR0_PAEHA|nr:hypothetical protein [Paenibacillus harenae]MDQ0116716.1 hypothetical protein [Paenibacillus harenae]